MRSYIKLFAEKIRNTTAIDELISVDTFSIDNEHKGYLYAYRTERGIHIDVGASIGDCNFDNYDNMYCGHTLHIHLIEKAITCTEITLESRINTLLNKVIAQLDILAPIHRTNMRTSSKAPIL